MKHIKGFTIVELLIVIVVIGVLAVLSVVAYSSLQERTHYTVIRSDLSKNGRKLEEYRMLQADNSYPYNGTMFIAAGLGFSTKSYQRLVYCYDSGNSVTYALVARAINSTRSWQYTPEGGLKEYTGSWGTPVGSTGVCATANPALSNGSWVFHYDSGWVSGWGG